MVPVQEECSCAGGSVLAGAFGPAPTLSMLGEETTTALTACAECSTALHSLVFGIGGISTITFSETPSTLSLGGSKDSVGIGTDSAAATDAVRTAVDTRDPISNPD